MESLIQLGIVGVLLILGFSIGGMRERRHLRLLRRRELATSGMMVTDLRTLPEHCLPEPCSLVIGEVVVASDYFKTFAAKLRSIVGGEMRTFDALMMRARREAILRMLESAQRLGANHVVNVRLINSNISGTQRKAAAMAEVVAYGTAVAASPESPEAAGHTD